MSLPFFPQELPTSCVAACVRMVLAALGNALTEAEIRVRCDHSALGMRLNQVAEGLAVVVLEITAEQVTAHDPLYQEGCRSIGLATFEAAWNKADRETVIILPDPMSLAI